MNLLDLMVKVGVDDQATSKLGEIGGKAAGIVGGAAKVVAGGVAVAAAGVAAVTKASLDGYSAYEQAVGGVQKLYGNMGMSLEQYAASVGQTTDQARAKWQALGNAQATMLKQAQGAFATCGMSATQYMEQATSFSAALINSLGGDTEKAAAQTQKAMVSMSDNVNTFGTSMQDVQNAYQGFAKQNYTMLDNLKLGYGGTKEEMQRLISDANEYGKSIGKAGDLSIDSFSDIVDAIDLVQQKQQIAGTTSREAATTIEGSVNMMKAAWENWLTGLGSDDVDMSALTEQLIDSIDTAAKNIVPRVSIIISTVSTELVNRGPELASQIGDMLIKAFTGAFNLLADNIGKNTELPTFKINTDDVYKALDKVARIFETVKKAAKELAEPLGIALGAITAFRAASKVVAIIEGLQAAFTAWRAATEGVTIAQIALNAIENANPFVLIATSIGMLIGSFISLMLTNEDFRNGVIDAWNLIAATAQAVWGAVVDFFTVTVPQAIQSLITWFAQLPGNIAAFLSTVIASVVAWAANMASQAVSAGSQFISGIAGFLSALPGNIASWLSGAISTVVGWVSQFASNATSAASQFGSRLRSGLAAIPGTLGNIGSNIIQGIVNGITGAAGRVKDAISNAIGNAVDFAKHILGIASPSKVFKKFGYYTMEGMRLGIEQNAGLPLGAAEKAMAAVAEAGSIQMDAPDMRSAAATASVVAWLDANLGDVIASRTPYTGMRDFDRLARKAVAYA